MLGSCRTATLVVPMAWLVAAPSTGAAPAALAHVVAHHGTAQGYVRLAVVLAASLMKRIGNRIKTPKIFFARYAREASPAPTGQLENPLSNARGVGGFTLVAPQPRALALLLALLSALRQ